MLAIIKRIGLSIFLAMIPLNAFAHQLEPAVLDISFEQSDARYYFTLTNTDETTKEFDLTLVEIELDEETGQPLILGAFQEDWARVAPSITLNPHRSESIVIEVFSRDSRPESSLIGLHIVESVDKNSGIDIRTGFLALIFAQEQEVFEDYQILSQSITTPKWIQQLRYEALITSGANGAAKPNLILNIHSVFGRSIATLQVNPNEKRIPKGLSRAYNVDWDYREPGLRGWWKEPFGLYRAEVTNHRNEIVYSEWLVLLSMKKMIVAMFLLIAFSGIIAVRRNRKHV